MFNFFVGGKMRIKLLIMMALMMMLSQIMVVAQTENDQSFGIDSRGGQYVKNQLIVKLSQAVDITSVDNFAQRLSTPAEYFGIRSIDEVLQLGGAIVVKKMFPGAERLAAQRNSVSNEAISLSNSLERYYKVELGAGADIERLKAKLERDNNVERVEFSYVYETNAVPNDALYSTLQHLPQIKAPQAWDIHKGENGPEVVIGIHDSGCQWDHPDLLPNLKINESEWTNKNEPLFVTQGSRLVINPLAVDGFDSDGNGYVDDVVGYNFYNVDGTPLNDPYGSTTNNHGTHVAGISAGVTNNGIGISSVSWNVKFIPTKHSHNTVGRYLYNVEEGHWFLIASGVDIINMSWGGSAYSFMDVELYTYMKSLGIILISSAGNSNRDEILFPNSYPGVYSIASVASNDKKAYYSTYGIQVDVSSPGGDATVDGGINSTVPLNNYAKFQGTSMASPLAAGLVGLVKSYKPDWSAIQIMRQVIGTTDPIEQYNPSYIGKLGNGRINALRALAESTLNLPTAPRFALFSSSCLNQDLEATINPGDVVSFNLLIRNFNKFYGPGTVKFRLISSNPDLTLVNGIVYKNVQPDDLFNLEGLTAKVSSNAQPAIVDVVVRVETIDGEFLYDFPLQFNISGGVLVYEFINGSQHQSGTFLKDELNEKGYKVIYTNSLPQQFYGFDAVFLSLGNYAEQPVYVMSSESYYALANYLSQGGKLFMDASSIFSLQLIPNVGSASLSYYFGISSATYSNNAPFTNVNGFSSSMASGLNFSSTAQPGNGYRVERYTPSSTYGGMEMLRESTYGIVGVQTSGTYGQKVVLMSFALSGYNDKTCPSTKSALVDRILNFFGLVKPLKINMPDQFSTCQYTGSVILTPGNTLDCSSNSMMNQTITGGSGNYSISWTPQSKLNNPYIANPTVSNLANNATYKISVTDNVYGSVAEFTTVVKAVLPPTIGTVLLAREKASTFIDLHKFVTNYNPDNTYNWYLNNMSNQIAPATVSNWKVPMGTNYLYVNAENESGCLSATRRIILLGTLNKDSDEDISVGLNGSATMYAYPNVVSDVINVSANFSEETHFTVKVTDLLGNDVSKLSNGFGSIYDETLDLSNLISGTYFLIIDSNTDRIVHKFIKI